VFFVDYVVVDSVDSVNDGNDGDGNNEAFLLKYLHILILTVKI